MEKVKSEVKEVVEVVQKFKNDNKRLLIISGLFILAFLIYGWFNNDYHKKEIKALEKQISAVQKRFDSVIVEKERLKDSSKVYADLADQSGKEADVLRKKAAKEKKEKEDALAALRNLPKDVIDTFFAKRYQHVPKSNIGLEIDKNTGNEIVIELVEKDHLEGQLKTTEALADTLTNQVNNLKISLDFSNSALVKADSAIMFKSKQFDMQLQVTDFLKQDLKNAKNKAFWGKIKGTAVGLGVGLIIGIIAVK